MAEKIVMLALSPTMETGTIAKWIKKEGESISSGDVLCEVETDKATMDYESVNEGALLKIVAPEGAQVKVGDIIAIAGEPGESFETLLSNNKQPQITPVSKTYKAPETTTETGVEYQEEQAAAPEAIQTTSQEGQKLPGGVKASPLAREIARRRNVDLASVQGSGPGGRIIKEDIERASEAKPAGQQFTPQAITQAAGRIPVSEKRRVIAKRMGESLFTAPHFFLTIAVNAGTMLQARKDLNKTAKEKISFNAFLIKLVSEALKRYPMVNSSWRGDTIETFGTVDIGLAVAQKDGLITPIVRNCTSKGIVQIDSELQELVEKARNNKLLPQDYTNATFTISNLGSYGVREFTAIINPPASAILAVGEVFKEPVVSETDQITIQSTMMLTLSCDHRVIDGALAAQFARGLKEILENPIRALF